MMVSTNVRLLRPLGEGGMGAVWVADHLSLRTQVVVKFMSEDLAHSPEATARFSREAAAASQVKSPHVVQTFDHGVTADGAAYIVMELLEGHDLDHHLRSSGKLSPAEVVAVVGQLARALTKAHERGIVHRDIKPSNVFLCDAGGGEIFVKLLDFGIAKGPEIGIVGSTTRTGSFVGSPYYMSPEQVVGAKDIDFRTDLWSLGVVAFEALTGDKPFFADTVGALALKIHRDPLPRPSAVNPALGSAVDAWFERACAREPGERFASAKEMAEALAVAATGQGLPAAPSLTRPRAADPSAGLAETVEEAEPSAVRVAADARSETGAGVGLASQSGAAAPGRGRWAALGGIVVVAVAVGFVAPRWLARPAAPGGEPTVSAPVGSATAPAASLSVTPPVVLPPLPAPSAASVDPATSASAVAAAGVIPGSGKGGAGRARPRPSALGPGSPPPPGTGAGVTTKPPPGSDDDIK
jgi:serine/threonine-protein kinase